MSTRMEVLLPLASALLLAACGRATPAGPVNVDVTLTEFGVQSSLTQFKVGVPYHYVVTNKGAIPHEILVMPVVEPSSGMPMEDMHNMALGLIDEDDMPAGATKTMDIAFTEAAPAGTLEFACHVPGHYEAGMHLPITVVP